MKQQQDPESKAVDDCVRVLRRQHVKKHNSGRTYRVWLDRHQIKRVLTYLEKRFVEDGDRS